MINSKAQDFVLCFLLMANVILSVAKDLCLWTSGILPGTEPPGRCRSQQTLPQNDRLLDSMIIDQILRRAVDVAIAI